MKSVINSIQKILVLVFVVLLTLAYESHFSGLSFFNTLLAIILVILFVLSLDFSLLLGDKHIKYSLFALIAISLASIASNAFFNDELMFKDVRSVSMCIAAIIVGYSCNFNEKEIAIIFTIFGVFSLLVGMEQVTSSIGGFIIEDQYLADVKNSLGVLLATAAAGSVFLLFHSQSLKSFYLIWAAMAVFAIIIMLTIRARADTLTAFMMIFYLVVLKYARKGWYKLLILVIVVLLLSYFILPQSALDFIYNSFFQHYEGRDITAGRMERNVFGLSFIQEHWVVGNLNVNLIVPTIHNYVLYKLFSYGFLFAFPLLFYYFYLFICSFRLSLRKVNQPFSQMGYMMILIPFLVSIFEYSYPFGPGTATLFNFIILGYSLRRFRMNSYLSS